MPNEVIISTGINIDSMNSNTLILNIKEEIRIRSVAIGGTLNIDMTLLNFIPNDREPILTQTGYRTINYVIPQQTREILLANFGTIKLTIEDFENNRHESNELMCPVDFI